MKTKIYLYYGDKDWIDVESPKEFLTSKNIDIKVEIIPNSGHVFMLENPFGLLEKIVSTYNHEETSNSKIVYDNILDNLDLNVTNDRSNSKEISKSAMKLNLTKAQEKSPNKEPNKTFEKKKSLPNNLTPRKVVLKKQRSKTLKIIKPIKEESSFFDIILFQEDPIKKSPINTSKSPNNNNRNRVNSVGGASSPHKIERSKSYVPRMQNTVTKKRNISLQKK